jgi:hypothetical protein
MLFLREWLSELLSVLIWILGIAGTIGMILSFWDGWDLGFSWQLPFFMLVGAFLLCWGIAGIKMVEES